jgi:hypothetical protein
MKRAKLQRAARRLVITPRVWAIKVMLAENKRAEELIAASARRSNGELSDRTPKT